ncbi:2-isopropylmalate synthase [Botrimarina colliarenosi]|uniref:2-isopropylmalate synthase n=1 Tax=Botrimarina colliarenosi TaxID=2528001 RepID=A0A5C6ALF9_9BACT|nr:2-isopropylmalate synthase [Botrimarina colliarenosi]TWU00241.1 2-isopropylmalate synthase [Botrimarina colliarenosi]
MSRQITIFDTTLRDGEQSPGCSMNLAEKLEMAQALTDLRVDVIEAGFPIASPGDFESVKAIAELVKGVQVAGLARCNDKDIDRAGEALKGAEAPRIHVFLATSAIHREFKLKMDKEEILRRAVEGVKRARNLCDNVEFSPEDAARTELDFLCEVVEAAIKAGATTVNIPDTVGYATPAHMYNHIKTLVDRVPNIDKAVISMHCHDDLGMAVANSLAGIEAGAGQIECTMNGIGERAGNCALEEVVMALRTRNDFYNADTRIDATRLVPTSRLLSGITGMEAPRNKAIIGRNAFAHESGIHQDGMLKEPTTYEIMRPEDVGFTKTDLVLGKHSGRAALADRLKALGHPVQGETLVKVFDAFKRLADKKKEVYDADLIALVDKRSPTERDWSLVSYEVKTHTDDPPSATVTLRRGAEGKTEEQTDTFFGGDGPLDALFRAVEKVTGLQMEVRDYRVHSVTKGKDAQGEANIEAVCDGRLYRGRGVSTDTVEASTKAFIAAANGALAGGGPPADVRRNAV